jgi:hypothetical protein
MQFLPSDSAERSTFEAIFQLLDGASRDVIGPAEPRLLVIPIRHDGGDVIGGLWAVSLFRWLHLEMLFVPEPMRHIRRAGRLPAWPPPSVLSKAARPPGPAWSDFPG